MCLPRHPAVAYLCLVDMAVGLSTGKSGAGASVCIALVIES